MMGQAGPVGGDRGRDVIDGAGGALGLGLGGAGRGTQMAELLGECRHPGIGLVQPLEGGRDPLGRFTTSLDGFSDAVMEKFLAGNMRRLLEPAT